jgi:hypothetical protein
MAKLSVNYDEANDILEIEGIKYTGQLFRFIGGTFLTPKDKCFKIHRSVGGMITLSQQSHQEPGE